MIFKMLTAGQELFIEPGDTVLCTFLEAILDHNDPVSFVVSCTNTKYGSILTGKPQFLVEDYGHSSDLLKRRDRAGYARSRALAVSFLHLIPISVRASKH
jgi:hypothetical protein